MGIITSNLIYYTRELLKHKIAEYGTILDFRGSTVYFIILHIYAERWLDIIINLFFFKKEMWLKASLLHFMSFVTFEPPENPWSIFIVYIHSYTLYAQLKCDTSSLKEKWLMSLLSYKGYIHACVLPNKVFIQYFFKHLLLRHQSLCRAS